MAAFARHANELRILVGSAGKAVKSGHSRAAVTSDNSLSRLRPVDAPGAKPIADFVGGEGEGGGEAKASQTRSPNTRSQATRETTHRMNGI
jgi:hypothetical protein